MSRQREARQKQAAKERRAENRKLAERERARRRRNAQVKKVAIRGGAVVAVVAVVVAAVVVVRSVIRDGQAGPMNMASDGLLITGDGTTTKAVPTGRVATGGTPTPHDISGRSTGVLDIVMYVDYGDPASAQFWQGSGSLLTSAVASSSGSVTLEIHPVALETRSDAAPTPTTDAATDTATDPTDPSADPTDDPAADPAATDTAATPAPTAAPLHATDRSYAKRAANAFACVAANVPDQALAVHDALLTAQPTLDSKGLSDSELVTLVKGAGVDSAKVNSCIGAHNFTHWVGEATDRATQVAPSPSDWRGAVVATPTVVVAGQEYTGAPEDAAAFGSFVDTVYASYNPSSAGTSDGSDGTVPDNTAPDGTTPDATAPEETVPEETP